ncbi:hypothetical protein G647_06822 [Cladophialophora carrionii CBS 160.54]|uniref:Transcription factor domain-containing protein n=1 Tax=Cladophialophora carrionii CBS 160.54 TaxID=1279043 RepID=V9D7U9_9EURO|nr:uncharacterized protein G647_06822 [Cladophialophora carrionii CBS 160.54]ETI22746.1 hypothetical protein G647_06822 [Cladophialophora carrionii CBS 160.54]
MSTLLLPHEYTFIHVNPSRSHSRSKASRLALRLQRSEAQSQAAYTAYRARQVRKAAAQLRRPRENTVSAEISSKSGQRTGHECVDGDSDHQWSTDKPIPTQSATAPSTKTAPPDGALALDVLRTTSQCRVLTPLDLQYEWFRGLRRDPFLCTPASEPEDGALIDFFAHDIGPINESVAWIFNVTNMAAGMLEMMAQDGFYDVMLCVLQSMRDSLASTRLSPSVAVLRRKGRAIANIRAAMARVQCEEADSEDAITDPVLCAILLLAVLEGRFQATSVSNVHKKTMSAITSQRGGLGSFEGESVFKASAMQFDTIWMWETGTTMFPGLRRSHDPVYPSDPSSMHMIQSLPIGFRDLFLQRALSYDILPVLTRATHFSRLSARERAELLREARKQKKAFNDFCEACPCLGLCDDKYHPLERLLTLSIMGYIYGAFAPRAFPTSPGGPTPDLTKRLMSYQPTTMADEACSQWMWILAINLSWTGSPVCPDKLLSMLQLQLRYPEFRSVERILELGSKFLWTQEMTKSIRSYWQDVTI